MDETNLVCIHETRIAHHVASIGQINCQYSAATILDRTGTVVVKLLIVVSNDVATGKHCLDMREKFRIDCHHVLEVSMNWAIFIHPNLSISLHDPRLNLTNLFVNQNRQVFVPVPDRLTSFNYAVWTKRVSGPRPSQSRLGLLPRL